MDHLEKEQPLCNMEYNKIESEILKTLSFYSYKPVIQIHGECDVNNIKAYIGPCISQKSYEVSLGFEKPFLDHNPESERFFRAGKTDDKLQFDLAGYCAYRLSLYGVKNIHIDGTDTLTNENYHSHRGGATSGERNLSAIMIKC